MYPGRFSANTLLVLAIAAILTTGGAVYGWSSLSVLLEREGEFSELCDHNASGCAAQQVAFDRIFTISTSTMVMLFFTTGVLLDLIGPRQLCMLGAAIYALGCYLIAVSASKGPNLYILGYSLLSWGGPAIFLSFIPLSALYGRWSHTVLCAVNSAFDATPYLFSLFQLIARAFSVTHTTIFAVYSIVPITIALTAPFLWANSAADYKRPEADDSEDHTEAPASKGGAHQDTWYELYVALKAHAFTSDYAWLLAIQASGLIRINFYLGTVELQLRQLVDPSKSWVWVDVFSLAVIIGAIAAIPLGGRLLQHGRVVACIGLLSVWLVFNILSIIPHIVAQVGSFFLLSLFRPFFYSCASSFMAESFGFKYFGFMYGFASMVGAGISFLQWPIVSYIEHQLNGDFLAINSAFLLLQLPLIFYPFYLLRKQSKTHATPQGIALLSGSDDQE